MSPKGTSVKEMDTTDRKAMFVALLVLFINPIVGSKCFVRLSKWILVERMDSMNLIELEVVVDAIAVSELDVDFAKTFEIFVRFFKLTARIRSKHGTHRSLQS